MTQRLSNLPWSVVGFTKLLRHNLIRRTFLKNIYILIIEFECAKWSLSVNLAGSSFMSTWELRVKPLFKLNSYEEIGILFFTSSIMTGFYNEILFLLLSPVQGSYFDIWSSAKRREWPGLPFLTRLNLSGEMLHSIYVFLRFLKWEWIWITKEPFLAAGHLSPNC